MSTVTEVTESLRDLRAAFASKREIILSSVEQFGSHKKQWDDFFSENQLISSALSYAKSHKQSRVQKLIEFDASFEQLFFKNVDLLLAKNCDDWNLLDRFQRKVQTDRALNVADPIWTNFLRCFRDLIIYDAEPQVISSCRDLIGRIQRWEPDDKFIVGESRIGLNLFSASESNDVSELRGNL
jgi:hypothetical protein